MRLGSMWEDVEQNTDEWLDMRISKVTGSAVGKIMANYGKAFGEPAKKAAITIARESVTGKRSMIEGYSNAHMERGHEQEPIARALYETLNFCDVTNGGFYDNGFTGCSPDGLVNEDGVIEIKSVIDTTHFANIQRASFDPAYKWQLFFNLKESGREWIDFVSYCADFPEQTRIFTHRIWASLADEQFKQIDLRLLEFKSLVDEYKKVINGN